MKPIKFNMFLSHRSPEVHKQRKYNTVFTLRRNTYNTRQRSKGVELRDFLEASKHPQQPTRDPPKLSYNKANTPISPPLLVRNLFYSYPIQKVMKNEGDKGSEKIRAKVIRFRIIHNKKDLFIYLFDSNHLTSVDGI